MENNEVSIDEPVYNPTIEDKIDTIIQYQNAQYGLSLFTIGIVVSVFVIILLYKFITHFFEF
jgi:hypothetical protein